MNRIACAPRDLGHDDLGQALEFDVSTVDAGEAGRRVSTQLWSRLTWTADYRRELRQRAEQKIDLDVVRMLGLVEALETELWDSLGNAQHLR